MNVTDALARGMAAGSVASPCGGNISSALRQANRRGMVLLLGPEGTVIGEGLSISHAVANADRHGFDAASVTTCVLPKAPNRGAVERLLQTGCQALVFSGDGADAEAKAAWIAAERAWMRL